MASSAFTFYTFQFMFLFSLHLFKIDHCFGVESSSESTNLAAKEIEYLRRYGYMSRTHPNDIYSTEKAIRSFQRFAKIAVTGKIDKATRKMMQRRRCGVADVSDTYANYKLSNNKWSKSELTYRVKTYTKDIPVKTQSDILEKAFDMWSKVTPLDFTKKETGESDIDVLFAVKDHGDAISFDGSGGVLAHAFYPDNGDVHFDDDENWQNVDLHSVAVHELGHAIGLAHSEDMNAVMAPFYKGTNSNRFLTQDDIDGAQAIYGKRTTSATTAPTTEITTPTTSTTTMTTTTEKTTPPPSTTTTATTTTTTTEKTTPPTTTTTTATTTEKTTPTTTTEKTTPPPPTTTTTTTEKTTPTTTTEKTTPTTLSSTTISTTKSTSTETSSTLPSTSSSPSTWTLQSTTENLLSTILQRTTQEPTTVTTTSTTTTTTTTKATTPTTTAPPPNIPNFECPFPYSAVMRYYSEGYLAYMNGQVFKLDKSGYLKSGPHPVQDIFKGAPFYVSAAAFDPKTNSSYLFSERSVYKYVNNNLEPNFPQNIKTYVVSAVVIENKLFLSNLYYFIELDKDNLNNVLRETSKNHYPIVPFFFSDTILSRNKELVFIDWEGYTICQPNTCYRQLRC